MKTLDYIDVNGKQCENYLTSLMDEQLDEDTRRELPTIIRTIVVGDAVRERKRQITDEGFSIGHDDQHTDGELSIAAACYAVEGEGADRISVKSGDMATHPAWPLDEKWDKRKKHGRYMRKIIAAALLIADAERIYREERGISKSKVESKK